MQPQDGAQPGDIKILNGGFSPLPMLVKMTWQGSALTRGANPTELTYLGRELGESEQE